jgi:hypothetical protein
VIVQQPARFVDGQDVAVVPISWAQVEAVSAVLLIHPCEVPDPTMHAVPPVPPLPPLLEPLPPPLPPPLPLALPVHWLRQFCCSHAETAWSADMQLDSSAFDVQVDAVDAL